MSAIILIWVVFIGTTIWVYFDAKELKLEGAGVENWVLGCLLLWIVAFPMYLAKRPGFKRALESRTALEKTLNQPEV